MSVHGECPRCGAAFVYGIQGFPTIHSHDCSQQSRTHRRVLDCGDGIEVHVCIPEDASPEMLDALRALGRAAAKSMDSA